MIGANLIVFWSLASAAADGSLDLAEAVIYAQTAVGTSMIAFGGLNWVLDGSSAPVAAVLHLEAAMAPAGALGSGSRSATTMPAGEIRFRDLTFAYPAGPSTSLLTGSPTSLGTPASVLDHFDLTIPAGSSLAIVGQNGAGKTTLAKLLCRLYDPQSGAIEVDGIDLRELDLGSWRRDSRQCSGFIHLGCVARQRRRGRADVVRELESAEPRIWPASTRCWRGA